MAFNAHVSVFLIIIIIINKVLSQLKSNLLLKYCIMNTYIWALNGLANTWNKIEIELIDLIFLNCTVELDALPMMNRTAWLKGGLTITFIYFLFKLSSFKLASQTVSTTECLGQLSEKWVLQSASLCSHCPNKWKNK